MPATARCVGLRLTARLSARFVCFAQISDEVWISILMSAFSGVIAVGVMLATFYFIRRHRLRALGARGGLTEALLRGEVLPTIVQLHKLHVEQLRLQRSLHSYGVRVPVGGLMPEDPICMILVGVGGDYTSVNLLRVCHLRRRAA